MGTSDQPQNERLRAVEVDTRYIRKGMEEMHADLRQHMKEERELYRKQDERLDAIEAEQTRVKTHLTWMKGIWVVVQGSVLAFLGLKK